MTHQTPKKRRLWLWLSLAAIGVFVVVAATVGQNDTRDDTGTGVPVGSDDQPSAILETAENGQTTVVYRVEGRGTTTAAWIAYNTDGGTTTNQEENVNLPWTKTLTLTEEALQVATLSAQGSGAGRVTVSIEVDGKKAKEASAEGYGVAMADANIGTLR